MPSTGRSLHTIDEVYSDTGDNVKGDGDDSMEDFESEVEEEFGSPTRLMNHFM